MLSERIATTYCCYSREGHLVGVGQPQDWDDGKLIAGGGDDDGRVASRQRSRAWGDEHDGETKVERPFRGDVGNFLPKVLLRLQQRL